MALAVVWTLIAAAYGWLNLPRARYIPHDPQFLSGLSSESLAILRGEGAPATPARGAWSLDPRIVSTPNGTRLAFPSFTTDARAALVVNEYHKLLIAEADQQRIPYLLDVLVVWLVPLLGAGLALRLSRRSGSEWRIIPDSAHQPAASSAGGDRRLHDETPVNPA